MKKLAFMFAAFAAISFASCGGNGDGKESGDSVKKDSQTVEQPAPAADSNTAETPAPAAVSE